MPPTLQVPETASSGLWASPVPSAPVNPEGAGSSHLGEVAVRRRSRPSSRLLRDPRVHAQDEDGADHRPEDPIEKELSVASSSSYRDSRDSGIPKGIAEVLASSFAAAQKAVSDSHERALGVLHQCMEELHRKEKALQANRELNAQILHKDKGTAAGSVTLSLNGGVFERTPSTGSQHGAGVRLSCLTQLQHDALKEKEEEQSDDSCESSQQETGCGNPSKEPVSTAPCMVVSVESEEGEDQEKEKAVHGRRKGSNSSLVASPEKSKTHPSLARQVTFSGEAHAEKDKKPPLHRRGSDCSLNSMVSAMNTFELLPLWMQKKKKRKKPIRSMTKSRSFESLEISDAQSVSPKPNIFAKIIFDPNSATRVSWDIATTIMILYDMVAIPLLLFDLPDNDFTTVMDWVTRLFWTADMLVSFVTGYMLPTGALEMRPLKVLKKYITTWFAVDLFVVVSDWAEVLWTNSNFLGFARAGKASRTFRLVRMVRLIRLARVRKLYSSLLDRLKSEQLVIMIGILNIVLVIMGLGHVIACIWYWISNQERPDTWLKAHGFEQADFGYKYSTALHWSLLQFAGGTDEIVPQNTDERSFAIGVFLLAFVMAAVFVGRLTSSMTQLHMLSRGDVERFTTLRRYLAKNEISPFLSMRVMHNAQHALLETQRFMEESQVELLSIISEPLRVELHFELYSPVLALHPFFRCFITVCPQVMKKVCHKAVSQLLVSDGDILFMPGEVPSPPRMLIVCSGELSYTNMNGAVAYVQAGQWISEAVLWVSWTHQGMLKATKDCRLLILDAGKFFQITDTFDHDFDIRVYARQYVNSLNSGSVDPSDLPWDEGCGDLMEAVDYLTPRTVSSLSHEEESRKSLDVSMSANSTASTEDQKRITNGSNSEDAATMTLTGSGTMPPRSVLMVTPKRKSGWW